MKNLNPRIERLKQMMVLEEKRAALQGELDSISQQLSSLKDRLLDEGGGGAAAAPRIAGIARKTGGKRQKRGLLKDKIMAALDAAGSAGVKVKDLAAALGITGQQGDPRISDALDIVFAACRKHGKVPGVGGVYDEAVMQRYIQKGARFILSGSDLAFMMFGARARSKMLRSIKLEP